ncbi:transcription initiation Spt4, partial [Patellaria atrata CBS 101060]
MSAFVARSQHRALRACMVCSIVQHQHKFYTSGCPNCDDFLSLVGNNDAIRECTSQVYEGLIALTDPATSWVAKWQRLDSFVPGTYAVKVTGMLPEDVLANMENAGVRYFPRDGSKREEEGMEDE